MGLVAEKTEEEGSLMSNALLNEPHLVELLQCPDCRSRGLVVKNIELVCSACGASFPLAGTAPILLRHDNGLFSIDDYRNASPDLNDRKIGLVRFVPSPSVNLARERVLNQLRTILDEKGICNILVVGGGSQRTWLDPLLRAVTPHQVVYSDIDSRADVDLFCDGHELPFVDESFDAVVTTAVLEHVFYPEHVAAEISRVIKISGLLYSELPFMQQVHEGAYDFTRYTLSGHRRLFNQFAEIDAGMVAGPATAFVWSLENLALAFASQSNLRKLIKIIVRLGFGWLKYLDYLLEHRPAAMDGASCTYFMGTKTNMPTPDSEIIAGYVGAKTLQHV